MIIEKETEDGKFQSQDGGRSWQLIEPSEGWRARQAAGSGLWSDEALPIIENVEEIPE